MAIFKGMDPNGKISGTQAWANLHGSIGGPLNETQRDLGMSFLNYKDPTGQQEIGGNDWNKLAEEAANMFGGSFQAWQPPAPAAAQPNPIQGPPPMGDPLSPPPGQFGQSLNLPAPITSQPYQPPSLSQVQNDPSYAGFQFARDQGIDAINSSHAAKGDLFTGGTMKELNNYAQNAANQYYGDVVNRDLSVGSYNREGQYGAYDRGVDASVLQDKALRDDRNFALGERITDREYESGERRWGQEFEQRANEFASSDEFRRNVYGTDDEYRRWRAGVDDAWKREVMDDERLKFMAGLGIN
jgi:hypothetical protein